MGYSCALCLWHADTVEEVQDHFGGAHLAYGEWAQPFFIEDAENFRPLPSGDAVIFGSGAKSSEEKPRYDLIPAVALEREAVRMAEGAKAHGENNYRQGVGDAAFRRDRINHLIEHALKYAAGDQSTDHLAAVRCNAAILMWLESASSSSRS